MAITPTLQSTHPVPSDGVPPMTTAVDRNLALELVRTTEAAAMAASRWMGRGDKNAADDAAVEAMRRVLHSVSMNGVVVIGEGEKDEAPMLYNGEVVGDGSGSPADVAVDPIDGTTLDVVGTRQRDRGDRGERQGHHVRSRSVRLHGQDRRRPGGQGTSSTSTRQPPRTSSGWRRQRAKTSATSPR